MLHLHFYSSLFICATLTRALGLLSGLLCRPKLRGPNLEKPENHYELTIAFAVFRNFILQYLQHDVTVVTQRSDSRSCVRILLSYCLPDILSHKHIKRLGNRQQPQIQKCYNEYFVKMRERYKRKYYLVQ